MHQRTKKLMAMYRALHPRDDIDWLYVSRGKGGRGLASIGDIVDTSIQRLEDSIEKSRGRLITATGNNTNDTRTSGTTITRKLKVERKTNPWTFQTTNKWYLTRENGDVGNKKKP